MCDFMCITCVILHCIADAQLDEQEKLRLYEDWKKFQCHNNMSPPRLLGCLWSSILTFNHSVTNGELSKVSTQHYSQSNEVTHTDVKTRSTGFKGFVAFYPIPQEKDPI